MIPVAVRAALLLVVATVCVVAALQSCSRNAAARDARPGAGADPASPSPRRAAAPERATRLAPEPAVPTPESKDESVRERSEPDAREIVGAPPQEPPTPGVPAGSRVVWIDVRRGELPLSGATISRVLSDGTQEPLSRGWTWSGENEVGYLLPPDAHPPFELDVRTPGGEVRRETVTNLAAVVRIAFPPSGSVAGTVINAEGRRVVGARVTLGDRAAETGSDGAFVIESVAPGNYDGLHVRWGGVSTAVPADIAVAAGLTSSGFVVPLPGAFTLRVAVETDDGRTAAGATVGLASCDDGERILATKIVAAASREIEIASLRAGRYLIGAVSSGGHAAGSCVVSVPSQQSVTVRLGPSPPTCAVRVVDRTGKDVAGADVKHSVVMARPARGGEPVWEETLVRCRRSAAGRFEVPGDAPWVPPGWDSIEWMADLADGGGGAGRRLVVEVNRATYTIPAGGAPDDAILIPGTASVEGSVVAGAASAAAKFSIQFVADPRQGQRLPMTPPESFGPGHEFRLAAVPAVEGRLLFWASSDRRDEPLGLVASIAIAPSPGDTVRLAPIQLVAPPIVRVVADGVPDSAIVVVERSGDGYRLLGLGGPWSRSSGELRLVAFAPGRLAADLGVVRVAERGETVVNAHLDRPAALSVVVTRGGRVVPGIDVTVELPDAAPLDFDLRRIAWISASGTVLRHPGGNETDLVGPTDGQGVRRVDLLPSGRVRVSVGSGFSDAVEAVTRPGDETEVRIDLPVR